MDACFEKAVSFLSPGIRSVLLQLDEPVQRETYEIRLRAEQPVVLFGKAGSALLQCDGTLSKDRIDTALYCSAEQLSDTFHRLCNYSVHTHIRAMTQGFVSTAGGDRVGVAGTAVCDETGNIVSVRDITSLNVRVARDIKGCADGLRKLFRPDQPPQSVLIAGAPSSGKTTLLRDLARSLSSFGSGCSYKTVVLDPRCELFPKNSRPGVNCDVFSAYPNRLAVPMAVRTFSPQLVVCDEVATAEEAAAIETGVNTGVRFLASIHAGSKKELLDRPLFRFLLEQCGFETVVLLRGAEVPGEIAGVFSRKELLCELDGGNGGVCSQRGGGLL